MRWVMVTSREAAVMYDETADELAPLIICLIEDQHVACDDWTEWAIAGRISMTGLQAKDV